MEIVRQGTKNMVTCGGCGSVLRFSPTDVRLVHAPVNPGPHEVECMPEAEDHYRAVVTCMSCQKTLPVSLPLQEKRALMPAAGAGGHYDW